MSLMSTLVKYSVSARSPVRGRSGPRQGSRPADGPTRDADAHLDSRGGDHMDDVGSRFLDVVHDLEEVAHGLSPEQAHAQFDATTLQVFWMKWPGLSGWAGSLWREPSAGVSGA